MMLIVCGREHILLSDTYGYLSCMHTVCSSVVTATRLHEPHHHAGETVISIPDLHKYR